VLLSSLLVGIAMVSDSEFVGTEKPTESETEESGDTELSVELGGLWAAGNTDTRTLSGKYDGSHRFDKNQFSTRGAILMGSSLLDADSDGRLDADERDAGRVETAKRQEAWIRYDRFHGDRDSFYALAGGFRDPYAGYDSRLNTQVGYSYLVVDPGDEGSASVVGELGLDVAREDVVDTATEPDLILAARASLSLRLDLKDAVSLTEELETLVNMERPDDSRVNSETSLTAKVSDIFAIKLSYRVRFDTQPVEGFARMDQTGLVTVVTSIF
jgi:putative salt-induced outer membrane protein YdiY